MKKVLLLGHTGFVGNVVYESLENDCDIHILSENEVITEKNILRIADFIFDTIESKEIDVVINCIAMANLDSCEVNKPECKLINTTFVKMLVDYLKGKDRVKLVHVSSNAVYDGNNPPYSESCVREPINYYGFCKSESDSYIEKYLSNYVIARPITVYGPRKDGQRDNPVTFIIKKLLAKESLSLVDDNIVNMIHVYDLSNAIKQLSLGCFTGVYNLSGDVSENRFDLGIRVAKIMGVDAGNIKKIPGDSFKMAAKRPCDTSFQNKKMKELLGIQPKDIDSAISEIIDAKAY